ncbi:hypothetical protein [Sinorhizobium meliloti]|uniref:hypothetical protein n=1 Tax=Rhizobium meliloti TaxID=382 RepID=UPI00299E5FAB|nr:hypothetical protein [Sinorhizobium meliloti]MDW9695626.1 hypothetical protein [Sinorhizobium meliloti]MDW9720507.1 hypothetical protein [Sinorhizobium meliloti]MDW9757711.1 hypothetical protein [Sinorhizobium meliloti]
MDLDGIAFLLLVTVAGLAVAVCPFLLIYRPSQAGPFGVLVLFMLAGYYAMNGKSAFTEITAAVFGVGAFLLAGIVAIARIAENAWGETEPPAKPQSDPRAGTDTLMDPKMTGKPGKWSPARRA